MGAAPGRQRAAGPRAGGGRWARRSPRPPGRRPSARPRVCAPRPGGPRGGGSRRAASRRALGAAAADGAEPGRAGPSGIAAGPGGDAARRARAGGEQSAAAGTAPRDKAAAPCTCPHRALGPRCSGCSEREDAADVLAGSRVTVPRVCVFFHREPPVSPVSVLFPYCYGFGV